MGLKLKAELDGDGSGFDAMMNRANRTKDKFASGFANLKNVIAGAFTAGAITTLTKKTIDLAGHLRDVSDALAVNVEWFQKRANAAKLAGGSEEDLMKFIDTMNKSREDAFNNPGKETAQRFQRLGFSQGDLSNLNTMDFFDKLVKSYASGATAQATVDVEKVGGKAARNLLAAFNNGLADNQPFMSEDIINQLDDIGDEFTTLATQLMVDFAPAIIAVSKAITWAVNQVKLVGAFIGGMSGAISKKEMAKLVSGSTDKNSIATLNKAYDAGIDAAATEANEQKKTADALEEAKQKARLARRQREQSAPQFERIELDKTNSTAARGPALPTDSLVGIGNFLGRNPQLVNTVANQQLAISRDQLGVLKNIERKFESRNVAGETLLVPVG